MRRLCRVAFVALMCAVGCGHRVLETREAPPCVLIERIDLSDGGTVAGGRGQGVWIGDRVLTAAHVLMPVPRRPELVGEVLLNGAPTRILEALSGDLGTVAAISADRSFTHPDQVLEDWAVVRVSATSPRRTVIVPWEGPIKPGDTLYAIGFAPQDAATELRVIGFRVVELVSPGGRAADPRLVCIRAEEDLRGWSGAFVGRYDTTEDTWRFVGLLVGMVPGDHGSMGAFVVRPPAAAWRSFGVEHR
jgi:hypothetical protein